MLRGAVTTSALNVFFAPSLEMTNMRYDWLMKFTKDSNFATPIEQGVGSAVWSGRHKISSKTEHVSICGIFQLQRAVLGFLVILTLGFLAAFLVTNQGMLIMRAQMVTNTGMLMMRAHYTSN